MTTRCFALHNVILMDIFIDDRLSVVNTLLKKKKKNLPNAFTLPFPVSNDETLILELSSTDKPSVEISNTLILELSTTPNLLSEFPVPRTRHILCLSCLEQRDAHPRAFHHRQTICWIFLFQEIGTFACLSSSRLSRRSSQSFSSPTNHLSDFPVPRTRHLCMPFSVSTIETLIL